jgi:catechol 2,3-dioxygenase-like lactoylglutathione lyase family enzyme
MKRIIKRVLIVVLVMLLIQPAFTQVIKAGAIGITVKDMNRSVKFYHEVLGFKKISDTELSGPDHEALQGLFGLRMRVVRMQLGDELIDLTDYLTAGGRSIPEDQQSNDLFFQHIAIVVSDMEKAYRRLQQYNVEHVSTGPQTLPVTNVAAAGIKAFYFHDPDNHTLELIYFPKGKGQAKWQQAYGKLFLGIDHTAIGISNTESSHRFYHDLLGIERKGDSWNKGTEQEHLNNVAGASLHITGYRASGGPGIEFLEYLHPGAGKSYPADSRTDDIWHWQTMLIVDDAEKLYNRFVSSHYKILSSKLVHLPSGNGHSRKAFIVRDDDGHAVLLTEEK